LRWSLRKWHVLAGRQFTEELRFLDDCRVGDVKVVQGHHLPCKSVLLVGCPKSRERELERAAPVLPPQHRVRHRLRRVHSGHQVKFRARSYTDEFIRSSWLKKFVHKFHMKQKA
jgi:hypothetical protein